MSLTRARVALHLKAASSALGRGQARDLAEQLLSLWRQSRDPELAELYERLLPEPARAGLWGIPIEPDTGASTDSARGSSSELRAERFRLLAQTRAGDPTLLPTLLADPYNEQLDEEERLQLLRPWAPDPALASALARWLQVPHVPDWLDGQEHLRIELIRELGAQRDIRQLDTLEQLALVPRTVGRRRQLHGAISNLRALRAFRLGLAAHPEARPLLGRAERLASERDEERTLLAAVHADPDDMAARLVYADWLSAHGDPRGEFITLQLRALEGAPPQAERERELLERHGARWVGPLHTVLNPRGRVFKAGFLARASIEARDLSIEQVELDEWATLRSLDGHLPELLALRGRLDALEQLYGFLSLERFTSLRAAGCLQSVSRWECSIADPNLSFDTPLGLRALHLRHAIDPQLIRLLSSPAVAGLEELGVYYQGPGLNTWVRDHRERIEVRARVELLRAHLPDHIGRVRMLSDQCRRASQPVGYELVFERGRAHAPLARVRVELHPDPDDPRTRPGGNLVHLLDLLGGLELEQIELGAFSAEIPHAVLERLLQRRLPEVELLLPPPGEDEAR